MRDSRFSGFYGLMGVGLIIAILGLGVGFYLASSPTPVLAESPRGISERFGVAVGLVDKNIAALPGIRAAGAELVRTDMYWEGVEPVPGTYQWRRDDIVFRELKSAGLRPYVILAYGNRNYSGAIDVKIDGKTRTRALPPITQDARAAYKAFAVAAVQRYKDYNPVWEIWNEPDVPHFWPATPDAQAYSSLARETCEAIRKVDPDAVVVGPAAAHLPTPSMPNPVLFEEFSKPETLGCFNAMSVHPYYLRKNRLFLHHWVWSQVKHYAASASTTKKVGVISGEWGVSSNGAEADESTQAEMLTKTYLLNLAEGVNLTIWYNWQNSGDDPRDREHNFGLLRADGSAKPALLAYQTLTRQLANKSFLCKPSAPTGETRLLFLDRIKNDVTLTIWNDMMSKQTTLQLPLGPEQGTPDIVSHLGERISAKPSRNGNISVNASSRPIYVHIGKVARSAVSSLCRS